MIGVFAQGPLVKLGGLFVRPCSLGILAPAEIFLGRPLVNRRNRHLIHNWIDLKNTPKNTGRTFGAAP